MPDVSVILPCYNPPQDWERNVVEHYTAFCDRIKDTVELIIVIDGVSDRVTDTQLQWLRQQIPGICLVQYTTNMGKGYAIRQGVQQASGQIIIYTDIDFPYTADSMYFVYAGLAANHTDLAIGIKDEQYYSHQPALRRSISRILQGMIKLCFSLPVSDTQCGLKGFRKGVAPVFTATTINRYLFDLEFIRNCYRSRQYRISAIPVSLRDGIHFRKMNYRILLPELLNFVSIISKRPNE